MSSLIRFFRRHRKGTTIAAGAFILVIGLTIYSLWSYGVWSTYTARYETWKKSILLSLDEAPATETAKSRIIALEKSQQLMASGSNICKTSPAVAWQATLLPVLRSRQDSCNHTVMQTNNLSDRTNVLVGYIKGEEGLAKVLNASSLKRNEASEGDFGGQTAAWQAAITAIDNLSVNSSFMPIKDVAKTKLGAVVQAWQLVEAAHAAKNAVKFQEATTKLTAAYASANEISTVNQEHYTRVIKDFQEAYASVL